MKISKLPAKTDLSSQNIGNKVADILAKELFSGTYKPGDMLPKETVLTDTLSVSRASIGSGMQLLATLGMIRRQAGLGTVVEEYRDWNLLDPRVNRWMVDYAKPNSNFLKEIVDYRYAIEPYVTALAAKRATAQDLAAIESAYNLMAEEVSSKSRNGFRDADIDFHVAIYRATHNLIWSQSANILQPAINLVIKKSTSSADELSDSLSRHHRVLECIRLRQPAEAFDAATHVLDRTAEDLDMTPTEIDDNLLVLMKKRSLQEE